jgi:predicted ester cyclase
LTTEENKEIVRLLLQGQIDAKAAAALWAPDALNHGRRVDPPSLEFIFESINQVHEKHTIHEMVAEGEWVAVRTTCQGTFDAKPAVPINSGIFSVIEPTGKDYTVQHVHLFRIVDGKIKEHWANRDDLGAARQIGLELGPKKD